MTKQSSSFYRPELDVVRFFAFAAVFLDHTLGLYQFHKTPLGSAIDSSFAFGLPLFFVLSAYLITLLLLRERGTTGTVQLKKFYGRRILRIWPLYFAALAGGVLYSHHFHILRLHLRFYLAALVLCGNLVSFVGIIVGHLWSISLEEQFYLFWPTVMKVCSPRRMCFVALALLALANVVLFRLTSNHAEYITVWANTFVQFESFAAGILLALFDAKRKVLSVWLSSILILCIPLLWIAIRMFLSAETFRPWGTCLGFASVTATCVLLLVAIPGIPNWPRPLVYLGKISYGLYVFHNPALWIVGGTVGKNLPSFALQTLVLFVTIGCAALSYHFFETPFLRLKRRLEVVKSRPV